MSKIELYCDTGNLEELKRYVNDDRFRGFTTNPSLIAKEIGDKSYLETIQEILNIVPKLSPISFEVVSIDTETMYNQAMMLADLAPNVYVKIPILNPDGSNNTQLIFRLMSKGININVTCIGHSGQVKAVEDSKNLILSVFAGRIQDTLNDAESVCDSVKSDHPNAKVLWASMRELYNIKQAERCGCDIITVPTQFISKFNWFEYSLDDVSRLSSEQFYNDAIKAGLTLS
jgi:transaldolase